MCGGFDDGGGAFGGVAGFENAGADKNAVNAELHHQRSICRGGDTAGGKVDHR